MQEAYLERMRACGVVPVVTVPDEEAAVPLAEALKAGGIDVIELTLRTGAGLAAIERVARDVPDVLVVAGTVLQPSQFDSVKNAGAALAVSPGFSEALHEAAERSALPWLPGVATASDVMRVIGAGRQVMKFFPAELAGGTKMLKALSGPFPEARFCPTGGIDTSNLGEYLGLSQVMCVGGSWLVPLKAIAERDWGFIRAEAHKARQRVDSLRATGAAAQGGIG